jgi:uncharacterized membrane protein YjjP (DUF1212 family)
MRVAVAMLASGAQTDDVEAAIRAVADAYGLPGAQASVTFSIITISYDPAGDAGPTTLLHIVRDRTSDFGRLAAAAAIVRRVRDGELPLADVEDELARLEEQPSPYARVTTFVASGVSAAASTLVFGGDVVDAATTLVIALLLQPALRAIDRSTLPAFFRLAFGAGASTVLVGLAVWLGLPIVGGLVLTGSLLRFLPGYALVSGVRDLIDGSMISGTARTAEAILLAAAVAGGIAIGLTIAGAFGVFLSIVVEGFTDWGVVVAALSALVAVGAFAVTLGVPRRPALQAAALGAVAWLGFIILVGEQGTISASLATLGAAVGIGFLGRILARIGQAPVALWVVPAILPLLPGLQLVRGMLADTNEARITGLAAAAVTAFLIGTGVATGDLAARTLRRVRTAVVEPAVGAVAGGVDLYVVTPVGRVVDHVRGGVSRPD